MNARLKRLRLKVKHLPDQPGVYLMKNSDEKIIYVGKAKNLKNRVRSYFSSIDKHTLKTKKLVDQIDNFDIIVTSNEAEALLTERTLIRNHAPWYNILLRDDKEFPYIRVDFNEDWPRIEKVRRRKEDGARYYGPFGNTGQLHLMMKSIARIFPIIRCSRHEFKNAKRPCTYYHMKMCMAPCVYDEISSDGYKDMIRNALLVLSGRNSEIKDRLSELMDKASTEMRYEDAAKYRDQIEALDFVKEKQTVVVKTIQDADFIQVKVSNSQDVLCFMILKVRESRLIGSDHFMVNAPAQDLAEAMTSFLTQYYDAHPPPQEIVLPFEVSDSLPEVISSIADGKKIKVTVPQKGDKKKLLDMADENAKYQIDEIERTRAGMRNTLEMIQGFLGLKKFPRRIECIDISNMQGQAIVASDVCFIDGRAAKEQYRIYNVETVKGKNDDFASIAEIVERRIKRALELHDMPDLLMIDGGKGQLSAAMKVLENFTDLDLEVVAIAKSRVQKTARAIQVNEVERSYERIFKPGADSPYVLRPGSPEFRVLTQIRDEAHRFAIQHHRRKRQRSMFTSELDAVPGVGPKMKQKLLDAFGSVEKIKQAPLEQLREAQGITEKVAVNVHRFFND